MSDFFTRLAELSLGEARVVQPEIAPRFAQGPEVAENISQDSLWIDRATKQTSAPQFSQPPAQLQSPETSETPLPPLHHSQKAPPAERLSQTAVPEQPLPPAMSASLSQSENEPSLSQTEDEGASEVRAEWDATSSTEKNFAHESSPADVSIETSRTVRTPPHADAASFAPSTQQHDQAAATETAPSSRASTETSPQSKEGAREAMNARTESSALQRQPLDQPLEREAQRTQAALDADRRLKRLPSEGDDSVAEPAESRTGMTPAAVVSSSSVTEPAENRTWPLPTENEKTGRPFPEQSQQARPEELAMPEQENGEALDLGSSQAITSPQPNESQSTLSHRHVTDAQAKGGDVPNVSSPAAARSSHHHHADTQPSGSERPEKSLDQSSTDSPESFETTRPKNTGDRARDSAPTASDAPVESATRKPQDEAQARPMPDGANTLALPEQNDATQATQITTAHHRSHPEEMPEESQQESQTAYSAATNEDVTNSAATNRNAIDSDAINRETTNRAPIQLKERETQSSSSSPLRIESGAENISSAAHAETTDQPSAPDAVTSSALSRDAFAPPPQSSSEQRASEKSARQETTLQADSGHHQSEASDDFSKVSDGFSETTPPDSRVGHRLSHQDTTRPSSTHETTHKPQAFEPSTHPARPTASTATGADESLHTSASASQVLKPAPEDSARQPAHIEHAADASLISNANPHTDRRPAEHDSPTRTEASDTALSAEHKALQSEADKASEQQHQRRTDATPEKRINATPARESSAPKSSLSQQTSLSQQSSLSQPQPSAQAEVMRPPGVSSDGTPEADSPAQPDSKDHITQSSSQRREADRTAQPQESGQHQDSAQLAPHERGARVKEERSLPQPSEHARRDESSARVKKEPDERQRDKEPGQHLTQPTVERNAMPTWSSPLNPSDDTQPERDQQPVQMTESDRNKAGLLASNAAAINGSSTDSDSNEAELPMTPQTSRQTHAPMSEHHLSTEASRPAPRQASSPTFSEELNERENRTPERASEDSQEKEEEKAAATAGDTLASSRREAEAQPAPAKIVATPGHTRSVGSGERQTNQTADGSDPQRARGQENLARELGSSARGQENLSGQSKRVTPERTRVSGARSSRESQDGAESSRRNSAMQSSERQTSSHTHPKSIVPERAQSLRHGADERTDAAPARSPATRRSEDAPERRTGAERKPIAQNIESPPRAAQSSSHREEHVEVIPERKMSPLIEEKGSPLIEEEKPRAPAVVMSVAPQQSAETPKSSGTVTTRQPDKVELSNRALKRTKESSDDSKDDSTTGRSGHFQERNDFAAEAANKGLNKGLRAEGRTLEGVSASTEAHGRGAQALTRQQREAHGHPSQPHRSGAQAAARRTTEQSTQAERREMIQENVSSSRHIIHVQIGRLVVRAQTPEKPSKPYRKTTMPRPGLSLEDYLKRRKGGRH